MSLSETDLRKKTLIHDDQSWNVYENKRNMDKLTARKSDIYGNLTWILQKNSGFEGQFSLIETFRAGFVRIIPARFRKMIGIVVNAMGYVVGSSVGWKTACSKFFHNSAFTSRRRKVCLAACAWRSSSSAD
jgi:hypothetical protein